MNMNQCIVYFSWSGNTERLAKGVSKELDIPIYRLERETPYSDDYNSVAYGEAKKEKEEWILPKIKKIEGFDHNAYDRILLFFPVWWYTFPLPVASFLKELKDYKGEVYMFPNAYSNDPKYLDNSIRDGKKENPSLNIKEGLFNKDLRKHISFIKEL